MKRSFRQSAVPIAAAAVAAAFLVSGCGASPATASPSPTPSPLAFNDGPLAAGRYVMSPFTGSDAMTACMPEARGCIEDPADDAIRVTLTVPDGYEAPRPWLMWGRDGQTGIVVVRGGGLYSDPCHSASPPDIPVGPSVDDFATALANHPVLDATAPVSVTLGGFSGKYVDLQLPVDVTACTGGGFFPYEPGLYSQGPSHRWHLWILDVDGVRVVIQSMDYATTPPDQQAELRAIVDSVKIEP